MKKNYLIMLIVLFLPNISLAATEQDVLNAIMGTYSVGSESYTLPSDVKIKAKNYLNANELTSEQCSQILGCINQAYNLARQLGTTDISKVSAEDKQKLLNYVNGAVAAAEVEVQTDYNMNTITPVDKNSGKVIEQIELKAPFFKETGLTWQEFLDIPLKILLILIFITGFILLYIKIKNEKVKKCIFLMGNTITFLLIIFLFTYIGLRNEMKLLTNTESFLTSKNMGSYIEVKNKEIVNPVEDKPTIYPNYGEQYGILQAENLGINLSVFYGDSLQILKNGVGHYSGSYMPNEGKGIIYTTHNTKDKLYNLSKAQIGDKVKITTNYGEFEYKIYKTDIVLDTEKDKAPVETDKEILMIYTCYPFDNIGITKQRYIVYCERSDK